MRSTSIYKFRKFATRAEGDAALAEFMTTCLQNGMSQGDGATMMLSGGSTPVNAYSALSMAEINWDDVAIGLVDDRWVDEDSPGSNAAMIRRTLLDNKAAAANFVTLKTKHAKPQAGVRELEDRLSKLSKPFDVCVMGMGSDGHTASWFPGSLGLKAALDIENPNYVCAIDANGAPVAGEYQDRISLTLTGIMHAREIVLYITGQEKLDIFQNADKYSVEERPVKALLAAGPRLTVFWAP